jgi:hypothetical protein
MVGFINFFDFVLLIFSQFGVLNVQPGRRGGVSSFGCVPLASIWCSIG